MANDLTWATDPANAAVVAVWQDYSRFFNKRLLDRTARREIIRQDCANYYRLCWIRHQQRHIEDAERGALEREMDRLQPFIADSVVDPRWEDFIHTLPGYPPAALRNIMKVRANYEVQCGKH